jgi:hypothetical protein
MWIAGAESRAAKKLLRVDECWSSTPAWCDGGESQRLVHGQCPVEIPLLKSCGLSPYFFLSAESSVQQTD